jgi:hypothetical protein
VTVQKLIEKHDVTWGEVDDAFSNCDPEGWVRNMAHDSVREVTISETQASRPASGSGTSPRA